MVMADSQWRTASVLLAFADMYCWIWPKQPAFRVIWPDYPVRYDGSTEN